MLIALLLASQLLLLMYVCVDIVAVNRCVQHPVCRDSNLATMRAHTHTSYSDNYNSNLVVFVVKVALSLFGSHDLIL